AVLAGGSAGATENVRGVAVVAVNWEDLLTIAVAGSGGGTTGVAGSVAVNVILNTTRAYIGDGARINANNSGANAEQMVIVRASDITALWSIAGGVSGGGTTGVGAGFDVLVLTKNTIAGIGAALVNAGKDVWVTATSSEDILSIVVSLGGGGTTGIAGSVTVYVMTITTRAFVGSDSGAGANVHAQGNVLVAANETSTFLYIDGGVSAGGTAGIGASIAVVILTKTTEAFIGPNSIVIADGLRDSITVNTGKFTIGNTNPVTSTGDGTTPAPTTDANGNFDRSSRPSPNPPGPQIADDDLDGDGTSDADPNDSSVTTFRTATPGTQSGFRGVAVTAMNKDDVKIIAASAGGGGTVAVNIGGSILVLTTNTNAYVGRNTTVTATNDDPNRVASLLVAAGNDLYHMGIAAALSIAGTASVTPAAAVAVINDTVKAYIDDGAIVTVEGDVAVIAQASENLLIVAAGVAGSGSAAIGGAVTVIIINTTTYAYIGNVATSEATGTKVAAGGNVLVSANDDTKVFVVAGSLGVSGGAGIGASVNVVIITKDTRAYIGDHAQVNALGATTGALIVFIDMNSPFVTTSNFRGVAVQASSSENVFTIAASAAGGMVGLAGGVTIEIINSNTGAYIGAYAKINTAQSVNVSAVNSAKVFAFAGGLGAGMAGIAGGVDIGILRNNTTAYIADYAQVVAAGDVVVNAFAYKKVTTIAASVGAGAVGLAGSVTVWTIGSSFGANYSYEETNQETNETKTQSEDSFDSGGLNNTTSGTDSQAGGFGGAISGNKNDNRLKPQAQQGITDAGTTTSNSSSSSGKISSAKGASGLAASAGTTAYIGKGALVDAGGKVSVRAKDEIEYLGVTGSASGGLASIGASIVIVSVGQTTRAYIGENATIRAGNDIVVKAELVEKIKGLAYGAGGGIVALGASVVVANESSNQVATIDNGTNIERAGGTVAVTARGDRDVYVQTISAQVGGGAAGASVAIANVGGSTIAYMGSVNVGQSAGISVNNIAVTADSTVTDWVQTIAAAGGCVGISGAVSIATINPTIQAYILSNAHIRVTGNVTLLSSSVVNLELQSYGVAVGAGALGGSASVGKVIPTVKTLVGDNATIVAGGSITLLSLHNFDRAGNTIDKGVKALAVAGGGGLVGVSFALVLVESSASVETRVGSGTTLIAGNDITLQGLAYNKAEAKAYGISVGAVAVGVVIADATANGGAQSNMNGSVGGANNLYITAKGVANSTTECTAVAGGIGAGSGNRAKAETNLTVQASIGNSGTIRVTNDVVISAQSIGNAYASGFGVAVGVGAAGVSLAQATLSQTVNAFIGTGTSVTAGGNILIQAAANYDFGGSPINQGAKTEATAGAGGLVGITGADARSTTSANVETSVGAGSTLNAGNDITLQ
ncbi:MAG: hypothetical protein HY782_27325, partial [Chloroflexi bacterium]|nr:hypothetical protein [Chloroflexota bacterium]